MSAAVAAAAAAVCVSSNNTTSHSHHQSNQQNHRSVSFFPSSPQPAALFPALSRYESQKRRDWNTFVQYLKNHFPTLANLSRCTGAHVLEFLKYLDQFGETKVHIQNCPFFGQPHSPTPCCCPLKEAWGSLDAIIGRLRAAYEENGGGQPDQMNPFRAPAVRMYLREVRDGQAEARGIAYYI